MNIKRNHLPKGIKLTNPIHFLAIGFGSGASPYMPGTAGTVIAIPIYLLLQLLPLPLYTVIMGLMILFGFWICEVADKAAGVHDHPSIVWDEIVGYLLTMWAVPVYWMWVLLGFLLFRLFDIWKPWPVRTVDRMIGGGVGVVVDDLVAAVYAWIVLQMIIWVM